MKGVERKRGNRLGIGIFRTAVRMFGLRGAYGLLYFVGLYYLLADRPVVAACNAYVRRRFPGQSAAQRTLSIYRLFVDQGKSLIDRYYVAAGGGDVDIEIRGYETMRPLLADPNKGFILLTAHVGNWQVAMTALRRFDRQVYLMMRAEDNAAVKESLNIDGESDKVRVLFTDDPLSGVIEAMKAVGRGDLVSIMGDRTYGTSAAAVTFLGDAVEFPVGAFSIAAAAQCPVVVLLSARIGMKKYVVDVSHVIAPPSGTRAAREASVRSAVQQFALVLEDYVREHPYQWFVFRDIWRTNT